jgi:hypothetical protein
MYNTSGAFPVLMINPNPPVMGQQQPQHNRVMQHNNSSNQVNFNFLKKTWE